MTEPNPTNCPKCGTPIPENAPQGLCPKCVFAEATIRVDSTRPPGRSSNPPSVEEIASHFPELEVIELIGSGGMGSVIKARQPNLDRFVALKILSVDLGADPAFAERFNREARVLASLNHPNIVSAIDSGTRGPYCYLLMEYVDGVNLRQAMSTGGFPPVESLVLVQDICAALQFAHEKGILHRDIKPENVLIDTRGRVKIADFGIAKLIAEEGRSNITLTMDGSVLGSPQYMAPEQIETPGNVDQRADIYSLGVVFYELLTGELPLGRFAPPSQKSQIDSRIDEIVLRTLEKERKARYQSAGEVKTHVEAISRSPTPSQIAPARKPARPDGNAKFATASAILAFVSFIPGLIVPYALHSILKNERNIEDPGMIVAGIGFLTIGLPALLASLLGLLALGEIRRSHGRKSGYRSALIGALALPAILLFGILTAFLLKVGLSATMVFPILVAVGIIFAYHLLKAPDGGWFKGEHPFSRTRRPTLAGTIAVLGLLLAAVMLLSGVNGVLEKHEQISLPNGSNLFPTQEPLWKNGTPDVQLTAKVQPGLVVTFDLLRTYAGGQVDNLDSPQGYIMNQDSTSAHNLIQFGAVASDDEGASGTPTRIAVSNWNSTGAHSSDVTLDDDWIFQVQEPVLLEFASPGMKTIEIATLSTNGGGDASPAATLSMRLTAQRRLIPGFAGKKLLRQIVGFGRTTDWKAAWIKYVTGARE